MICTWATYCPHCGEYIKEGDDIFSVEQQEICSMCVFPSCECMTDEEIKKWQRSLTPDDNPEHLPVCDYAERDDGECSCQFDMWFLRCMHCYALHYPCYCEEPTGD